MGGVNLVLKKWLNVISLFMVWNIYYEISYLPSEFPEGFTNIRED